MPHRRKGVEVRPGCTEAGHGGEIVAQREQAAQECAGVHVVMAAAVEWRDQSGLGRQRQLRMQAGDGEAPQARAVHGSCRPDCRLHDGGHALTPAEANIASRSSSAAPSRRLTSTSRLRPAYSRQFTAASPPRHSSPSTRRSCSASHACSRAARASAWWCRSATADRARVHIAQASKVLPREGTEYARLSDVLQHFGAAASPAERRLSAPPGVPAAVWCAAHRVLARAGPGAVCPRRAAAARRDAGVDRHRRRHVARRWPAGLCKPVGQARLMRGDVRLPAGVR